MSRIRWKVATPPQSMIRSSLQTLRNRSESESKSKSKSKSHFPSSFPKDKAIESQAFISSELRIDNENNQSTENENVFVHHKDAHLATNDKEEDNQVVEDQNVKNESENEEIQVDLFEQEESECLTIDINTRSTKRNEDQGPEIDSDEFIGVRLPPLVIHQYNSHDHRWGIYSTVWEGGLAMAGYLLWLQQQQQQQQQELEPTRSPPFSSCNWNENIVIDVGAGTGIVGLAVAALSQGKALVHLTDLPDALSLLVDNVRSNSAHWESSKVSWSTTTSPSSSPPSSPMSADSSSSMTGTRKSSKSSRRKQQHAPLVRSLTWGEPIDGEWIKEIIKQVKKGKRKRILILGADIVYRVHLFTPLLATLNELSTRLLQKFDSCSGSSSSCNSIGLEVEIILACSSNRTNLNPFWKTARQVQGVALDWLASVQVPTPSTINAQERLQLCLDQAVVTLSPDPHSPPEAAPVRPGLVSIVKLRRLPYTFSI